MGIAGRDVAKKKKKRKRAGPKLVLRRPMDLEAEIFTNCIDQGSSDGRFHRASISITWQPFSMRMASVSKEFHHLRVWKSWTFRTQVHGVGASRDQRRHQSRPRRLINAFHVRPQIYQTTHHSVSQVIML